MHHRAGVTLEVVLAGKDDGTVRWTLEHDMELPQQVDTVSCALFTLTWMSVVSLGLSRAVRDAVMQRVTSDVGIREGVTFSLATGLFPPFVHGSSP